MWLVTCEDEQGMWWDDPIAADTEEEARKIALRKWTDAPEGVALVLYRCDSRGEVDRPAPKDLRQQVGGRMRLQANT